MKIKIRKRKATEAFNSKGLQKKKAEKATDKDIEPCVDQKLDYKTIVVHSAKYKTLHTKKYKNRKKWEKPNEKEIISFIPGTILKVFVKAGTKIKENDKILSYEAMKMQSIISSSKSGTIKKVNVSEGEKVPKGKVLIEME